MGETILLVDDEADVRNLVRYNLARAGFEVILASGGVEAVARARADHPDLMVLDVMMPGLDGYEVCRLLRAHGETRQIPILMLTARGDVRDRIRGLEFGVDDYLGKPFSPKELVLRIRAILRRSRATAPGSSVLEWGEFHLDRSTFTARVGGERVDLTPTEFKLLSVLLERRGRILSRETLLAEVWGYPDTMDTRTVDTHVRRLREKLGTRAAGVETVRGSGYRLRAPDEGGTP